MTNTTETLKSYTLTDLLQAAREKASQRLEEIRTTLSTLSDEERSLLRLFPTQGSPTGPSAKRVDHGTYAKALTELFQKNPGVKHRTVDLYKVVQGSNPEVRTSTVQVTTCIELRRPLASKTIRKIHKGVYTLNTPRPHKKTQPKTLPGIDNTILNALKAEPMRQFTTADILNLVNHPRPLVVYGALGRLKHLKKIKSPATGCFQAE